MKYKKICILCFFFLFYSCFLVLHSPTQYENQNNKDLAIKSPSASATNLYEWNTTWGGSEEDYGRGITVDGLGNSFVVGRTKSFGVGCMDVFVLKYDSDGNLLWTTTWGGSNDDNGEGIALDGLGNIYITGNTFSYGAGSWDSFLLKYNSDGNLLWYKTWGGPRNDAGHGIAIDNSGNIFVTGRTRSYGGFDFDVFLLKYDSNGNLLWNKIWGGSNRDVGYGIALDGSGNILVTSHSASYGAGGWDVLLLKFDSNGNELWYRTWGGSNHDSAYGIAVDNSGNAYISGMTSSFGGFEQGHLLKYDSDGNLLWDEIWGGSSRDRGYGIVSEDSGNVFITGYTESFGVGGADVILLKYDSDGTQVWNKTWGDSDDERGDSIGIDDSGNIYITGYCDSPIYGVGEYDAFLLKFGIYETDWYIYTRNDKKGMENIEFYDDIETWQYLGEEEYLNGVKIYDTYNRADWNEDFTIPIKSNQKKNYYIEEGWYCIHL
jgi:hypothetical protein